jgi:hypothetical protein
VSFDLYRQLAPQHQPEVGLEEAIRDLWNGLTGMGFRNPDFRDSELIRLTVLEDLQRRGLLTDELAWRDSWSRALAIGV